MVSYIVSVTLPGTLEHFAVNASGRVTIGRSEECEIRLQHPTVSRPHAEIESQVPGEFVVRDLGSRNGTIVNGQVVNGEVAVRGQPTLQIGPYVLTLTAEMSNADTVVLSAGDRPRRRTVVLDRSVHSVSVGGQVIVERLVGLEFRLLEYLDARAPEVVSNTEIGDHLWGEGQWDAYMLHNLVRRFRRKLEDREVDAAACLISIPGVGYRLA
jgi:DNA-binding winged helix-turn-helix (wHTH) protein